MLGLLPTSKDADLTRRILERSGIECEITTDLVTLCAELDRGAGGVLLAEEALADGVDACLVDWLGAQPPWSDLPVLLLARPGADSAAVHDAMAVLGNVTVLERPVRVAALVSSVRTALRARSRQYQAREDLLRIARSERELRDFFDNANVGLHWVGADGTILRVNQAELDVLGYAREEFIGRSIREFHVDRSMVDALMTRLARGETVSEEPARMWARDGSVRDVLISATAFFEDGRFVHSRSFLRDVTELQRAQLARGQLAAIVESSDDAIVSKSLEGIIQTWNGGAERLFGYPAGEAIGRHISLIIPAERLGEEEEIMSLLRSGHGVDHFETTRLRRDGRSIDVSLTISPIRGTGGVIVGASKIGRDISERKAAERALRTAADRSRLLWEAASVLLTAEDPETMLQLLFERIGWHLGVDAYLNYLATDGEEGLRLASHGGLSDEEARSLARLELGQGICGTAALLRRGLVASDIQRSDDPNVDGIRRFGFRAYVCNPLMAGERLFGTLSFASRSKDRFELDELEFLETICRYATAAHERLSLIDRLREADRRKDDFLAVLAHELRNPLAPIRNGLQILRLTQGSDPASQHVAEMMERQVDHLVRLVDDLLEVSRITRGRIELRREPVAVSTIIESAVETSRPLIDAAGHRLTVTVPPEPLLVHGDPIRLVQVVANLLNNAAKYTRRGGQIWVTVDAEGGEVVVSVRDTGRGLTPEAKERIFDLFAPIGDDGGLGIGLTLVKRLVEMHGGRVKARSEGPGRGSEFIVRLPLERKDAPAEPPAPERPAAPLAGCRILLADDSRDSADSLAELLELLGADVHVTYGGAEALAEAGKWRPDVALLDIGMPGMDGLEVARRIRRQPGLAGVTLVALSGWGQSADRRRSEQAGFVRHLIKPVELAELESLLVSLTAPETERPEPIAEPDGQGADLG